MRLDEYADLDVSEPCRLSKICRSDQARSCGPRLRILRASLIVAAGRWRASADHSKCLADSPWPMFFSEFVAKRRTISESSEVSPIFLRNLDAKHDV